MPTGQQAITKARQVVAGDVQPALLRAAQMRQSPCMDDATSRPPPAGWLKAMDESDADLAAGRTVSASVVTAELLAGIARLEATQAGNANRADQLQQASNHGTAPSRP